MEKLAITTPKISISVANHKQMRLVANLLNDLTQYCHLLTFELLFTLKVDKILAFSLTDFVFPINIIRNTKPLGFAANHNQAFMQATKSICTGQVFKI